MYILIYNVIIQTKNVYVKYIKTIYVYNWCMEVQFSERLKALRKEKGLHQSQLAEALNATQRKISYWETGKTEPDLASVCKICDLFDVSADFLLGRKDY